MTTLVAITRSARTVPNSDVRVRGSTMFTCPPVTSATIPNLASLQSVPLMVITDTHTLDKQQKTRARLTRQVKREA